MVKKKELKYKEEDMYLPVKELLLGFGYTVKSEVEHCDVTAVKEDELIVVEMKKSLNLDVIVQSVLRQKLTDKVYIAVPKPGRELFSKRWNNICHVLKRLGIGLILVSFRSARAFAQIEFEPEAYYGRTSSKKVNTKKRQSVLKEFNERHGDYNTGGSTRKRLVTAYKEMAIHIACCLERFGVLSPKQLRILGTDKDKTRAVLADNHYGWFDRVSNGKYVLNEHGIKDLNTHSELKEYYENLIKDKELS